MGNSGINWHDILFEKEETWGEIAHMPGTMGRYGTNMCVSTAHEFHQMSKLRRMSTGAIGRIADGQSSFTKMDIGGGG